jgi:hypothetical protein
LKSQRLNVPTLTRVGTEMAIKPTKPIKLAEIDLREKGVGYNGAVGLECQPSADFEAACKQAEEELNRGKQ